MLFLIITSYDAILLLSSLKRCIRDNINHSMLLCGDYLFEVSKFDQNIIYVIDLFK